MPLRLAAGVAQRDLCLKLPVADPLECVINMRIPTRWLVWGTLVCAIAYGVAPGSLRGAEPDGATAQAGGTILQFV